MPEDKFILTTSTSHEMASTWITRLCECHNLVLLVFSRRCKISERNMYKGKRMGRPGIGGWKDSASWIGTLLRAAYVSICSVANKIAFYEASKCHNPLVSLERATISSLIDLIYLRNTYFTEKVYLYLCVKFFVFL